MMNSFLRGDLEAARQEQFRSVQLVQILARRGFMGSAKALMNMLGVNVGPARLPHGNLTKIQADALRGELERVGFIDLIKAQFNA